MGFKWVVTQDVNKGLWQIVPAGGSTILEFLPLVAARIGYTVRYYYIADLAMPVAASADYDVMVLWGVPEPTERDYAVVDWLCRQVGPTTRLVVPFHAVPDSVGGGK